MKKENKTFAQLLDSFGYSFTLRTVFEDFLTLSMCAVTQDPLKQQSHYEDLYLQTIAPYKNSELRHGFPKAFAQLVCEMEGRNGNSLANDVLGNYYEQRFCQKNSGQFFTPWPVCQFMAHCTITDAGNTEKPMRVLDPSCGSGRTLMAGADILGPRHRYYGIDIDHTCVKMAALNLFLNGVFGSEVMCADALMPGSFHISYKISMLPLGIFRVEDKEQSKLWRMYNATFKDLTERAAPASVSTLATDAKIGIGQQLKLF